MKSFLTFILLAATTPLIAKTYLQAEFGSVWQSKNDVQIPPESGTYFEFDKLNPGPYPHFRLDGEWMWDEKQGLRALIAPFRIAVRGRAPRDIVYEGTSFSAAEDLTVNYRFDSYRVGYFYEWSLGEDAMFRFGGTGKIRSAKVELVQGERREDYSNLGFVPLLYVAYQQRIQGNWSFYSDMDFAAAPQGRAFDLTLKAKQWLDAERQWGFGIRTLEGGADNDKVVSWSWFNYLVLEYGVVI